MSWRQVRLSPVINESQVIGDCTAHGWEHGCVTSNNRFWYVKTVKLLSFGMDFSESLSWYFLLVLGSQKLHMPPYGWEAFHGHNYAGIQIIPVQTM